MNVVSNRIKKNNISLTNINEIMLSQIPCVSIASSSIIMEKYKTLGNLIKKIELSETALDDIFIITKTGKKRRLNKNCKCNIYNYLLQNK